MIQNGIFCKNLNLIEFGTVEKSVGKRIIHKKNPGLLRGFPFCHSTNAATH
jgi:hypothetical protein